MNRKEFFASLAGLFTLPVLGKKVEAKQARLIGSISGQDLVIKSTFNPISRFNADDSKGCWGTIGPSGPVGDSGINIKDLEIPENWTVTIKEEEIEYTKDIIAE